MQSTRVTGNPNAKHSAGVEVDSLSQIGFCLDVLCVSTFSYFKKNKILKYNIYYIIFLVTHKSHYVAVNEMSTSFLLLW